jgi:hypothetical protein
VRSEEARKTTVRLLKAGESHKLLLSAAQARHHAIRSRRARHEHDEKAQCSRLGNLRAA